jgi:succinyl-CoA synthetase alpha subunit
MMAAVTDWMQRVEPFVEADVAAIIQGITGRTGRQHSQLMRAYGTRIVGGVSPYSDVDEVDGVAIFRSCAEAVSATGAKASVVMVPPLAVLAAIREAISAGIRLIVTIAEGMPVADAVVALEEVHAAGVRWIGPSTPGLAIPGVLKLGFLPNVSLAPGTLGVMAKSGTLSYEVCHRLVDRGFGQSLWVGVGGDAVKGTRFADILPFMLADPKTRGIVVIGEIGGSEEEELAATMIALRCTKPVFALIAGRTAREGIMMGHAGALILGNVGTVDSKKEALVGAGAQVFTRIQELVDAVTTGLEPKAGENTCC